jgi:hypothetical protein
MTPVRRGRRNAAPSPRAGIVLALSTALIGVSGAAVWAAIPGAGGSDGVDSHRETATREEILAFWTQERLEQAEAPEMPLQPVECAGWGWVVRPHCW